MPARPRFRFSIATLLWLMVCVAVFFGGRWSREQEIKEVKRIEKVRWQLQLSEKDREVADLKIAVRYLEEKIHKYALDASE